MTFTTQPLLDGGVLVEGTDSKGVDGSAILRSDRWTMVKYTRAHELATAEFNDMVEAFFQPLTEAAAKHKAAVAGPDQGWATVTISEGVEGKEAVTVDLDSDGVLLRLLEEGKHDLLRWINGSLVALA